MTLFWKAAAGILIGVILVLAVGKYEKDIAMMLSMIVCVMTAVTALSILEPVIEFFYRLERLGQLQSGTLTVMLKVTGIGLVSEIAGMIMTDSGNSSLAKGIQLLGTVVIISLSLPVLEMLLELVQEILGGI